MDPLTKFTTFSTVKQMLKVLGATLKLLLQRTATMAPFLDDNGTWPTTMAGDNKSAR